MAESEENKSNNLSVSFYKKIFQRILLTLNGLQDSNVDEYLLAVANSYTLKIEEELNSDLELFKTIDTEALILQHNSNQSKEAVAPSDNTCPDLEKTEEQNSEEEVSVEEFIDILNKTDSFIVISGSSNE